LGTTKIGGHKNWGIELHHKRCFLIAGEAATNQTLSVWKSAKKAQHMSDIDVPVVCAGIKQYLSTSFNKNLQ